MKNILTKLNNFLTIKRVSYTSFILNLVSVILAIVYLITISEYNIFWDIFGIILLITLFVNILLIFLNSIRLNKSYILGNRINLFCHSYLVFTIIAMIVLFLSNFFISITYSNSIGDLFLYYSMIIIFFFGNLALGVIISYLDIRNLNNRELWEISERITYHNPEKHLRTKKILKKILKILLYFTLGCGVFFSIVILFGPAIGLLGFLLGIFIPQMATFLSFFFLSTTALLLKLKDKRKNPKLYYGIAICGLVVSAIFMMPLLLSPYTALDAEINFKEAFGDWRGKIDSGDKPYFLKTPFSIPQYFLGIPPQNCIIKEHILFYNGTTGADAGIQLHFDAYMPLNRGLKPNSDPLPGKNSTLIRIHGGGWTIGDKGVGNMMQMNKYFAAQGYVVFDIQYGLKGAGSDLLATPSYVQGDLDMDDIVRHIGIFCKYLTNHSEEYGANLDVVFISGGSAGGQLTCATALGIHSEDYNHYFGSNLTIRGLVPFYPANDISRDFGIGGDQRLVDPAHLVDNTSPPCLIYQGTHDFLVSASRAFRDQYISTGNEKCAIIWQYLGGHAADIYFSGHFNQIFLFYMERFLYMCVNNYI